MREHLERFLTHVDTGPGCWTWTGYLNGPGYAKFTIGRRSLYAHRYSHEVFIGPIPEGFEVDHLCGNPSCVRPSHLEAVTPRTNNLRSDSRAARNARATHCKRGHPLTGENLRVIRSADGVRRRCWTCTKRNLDAFNARKKEARR